MYYLLSVRDVWETHHKKTIDKNKLFLLQFNKKIQKNVFLLYILYIVLQFQKDIGSGGIRTRAYE